MKKLLLMTGLMLATPLSGFAINKISCKNILLSAKEQGRTTFQKLNDEEKEDYQMCLDLYEGKVLPTYLASFQERTKAQSSKDDARSKREAMDQKEREEYEQMIASREEITFTRSDIESKHTGFGKPVAAYRYANRPSHPKKYYGDEKSIMVPHTLLTKLTDLDDLCGLMGEINDFEYPLYGKAGRMYYKDHKKLASVVDQSHVVIEEGFFSAIGFTDEFELLDNDRDDRKKLNKKQMYDASILYFDEVVCHYNPNKKDKFSENDPQVYLKHKNSVFYEGSENDIILINEKVSAIKEGDGEDSVKGGKKRKYTKPKSWIEESMELYEMDQEMGMEMY